MSSRLRTLNEVAGLAVVVCAAVHATANYTSGQTPCAQKLSEVTQSAELYGFHLGMSKDEVKVLIPQTVFGRADEFGVVKTTINPYFDPRIDKAKFSGVRSISLDFLDDRLTSLWIGYDDTYKVQTVDEFVKMISQALRLSGNWTQWKSKGQQLKCRDFQVVVTIVAGGPSIRILDTVADETIAERRQTKEERDAAAEAAVSTEQETPEVIGDKLAKVYYPSGCKPAKNIDEANRINFPTVADAEKAGFKLGKTCH